MARLGQASLVRAVRACARFARVRALRAARF
jgi:hypothetical protein